MPENAFLPNTKTKTKICTEVLWKILEIPRPRSKIWKILEIPRPRPRFAQKSCGKSWKYQDQDPRFGNSWKYQDQDQDLHRSLVKNLGIGSWSWYFQDFPQDFCANLGLGISKIFQILDLGLGISKIFHKTSVQILVLVLVFPRFSKSWILVLLFPRFSTRLLCKSWSWSWYWAGMHSLAFSHSDCIPSKVNKQVMQPTCTNINIYIYKYRWYPPKKQGSKGNPK